MKRRLLPIWAITCVAPIALLLSGYFTELAVTRHIYLPGNLSVQHYVGVDDGRVRFRVERAVVAAVPGSRTSYQWTCRLLEPHPSRWFSTFDATIPRPGGATYAIQFPLWCLIAPLMIPPMVWFLRRRKSNAPRFPVIVKETT